MGSRVTYQTWTFFWMLLFLAFLEIDSQTNPRWNTRRHEIEGQGNSDRYQYNYQPLPETNLNSNQRKYGYENSYTNINRQEESGRDIFLQRPKNPYQNHSPPTSNKFFGPKKPGTEEAWRPDILGRYRQEFDHLEQTLTVSSPYGHIQGFYVYLYDGPGVPEGDRPENSILNRLQKNVSVFLGIPYAEPPTGENRFKPPRAHQGWQLLQATDYGPACPQPTRYSGATKNIREVDEDCLYLNVFSPSVSSSVVDKFPVIIYIHGGHFERGASNQFPPHQLVATHNIVVVTINYRLGALGFLSTMDKFSPGNYGLLDQALAIKWVHQNIKAFNGDPERITLMGEDAGAASAGLHLVSPMVRNFIHGVIAMGGSFLADWAFENDKYRVQNTSIVYGQTIGCTTETSEKLINCLRRGRNGIELGNHEIKPDLGIFTWIPVIDGNITTPDHLDKFPQETWHFLPDDPKRLVKQLMYQRPVHYMTGFTANEGSDFLYNNKTMGPDYVVTSDFFHQQLLEWIKQYNYTLNPEGVYNALRYMYTYWPDPQNLTMQREQYINFLSDALYKAPVDHAVKLVVSRGVATYMYHLNSTINGLNLPYWRSVPHFMEYYYITGAPFMDKEYYPLSKQLEKNAWTEGDRNVSEIFMKMVANFARYGEPTVARVHGISWEPAKFGQLKYLNINGTFNTTMMENYRQEQCTFWTEYLPTVVGYLLPTYPPNFRDWLELKEPIQIGFWIVSMLCLIFLLSTVICCCLWRSAKKKRKKYLAEKYVPEEFDIKENRYATSVSSNNIRVKDAPPSYTPAGNNQYKSKIDDYDDSYRPLKTTEEKSVPSKPTGPSRPTKLENPYHSSKVVENSIQMKPLYDPVRSKSKDDLQKFSSRSDDYMRRSRSRDSLQRPSSRQNDGDYGKIRPQENGTRSSTRQLAPSVRSKSREELGQPRPVSELAQLMVDNLNDSYHSRESECPFLETDLDSRPVRVIPIYDSSQISRKQHKSENAPKQGSYNKEHRNSMHKDSGSRTARDKAAGSSRERLNSSSTDSYVGPSTSV